MSTPETTQPTTPSLKTSHMTQALSNATTLAINKTSKSLTSATTTLKGWVDTTSIEARSLLSSTTISNPKSAKTYAKFLMTLVSLLFKDEAWVQKETNKFMTGIAKILDRNFIFPLDSTTYSYLTDLKRISSYNKIIAQQNMAKNMSEKATAVGNGPLIMNKSTPSSPTSSSIPNPTSPQTVLIPDLSASASVDPTITVSTVGGDDTMGQTGPQIQSRDEPLLDLPLPPPFSYQPTTTTTSTVTTATTLHPSGKGYGNLVVFFQHTVERQKELLQRSEKKVISAPDLTQMKENLQDLATSLNAALSKVSAINLQTQTKQEEREKSREERVEGIRQNRITIDDIYAEKLTTLQSNHKERMTQLKLLQNAPIVLPSQLPQQPLNTPNLPQSFHQQSISSSNSTQFTNGTQQQSNISISNDINNQFMLSSVLLSGNSTSSGLLSPMLAPISTTTTATRPGTANSQPLPPDVIIGDYVGDEAMIEGMIADMLSD